MRDQVSHPHNEIGEIIFVLTLIFMELMCGPKKCYSFQFSLIQWVFINPYSANVERMANS